ncbi:MAG: SprT-like domain-containing protein [Flavobacteriaceae bacterium]|nr:SprT-like domain-containing protein [Flavobacteriaceae bacterium]MDG1966020.1 SprT-like domain-containing protein [Flavobacteriaceae bacterium]
MGDSINTIEPFVPPTSVTLLSKYLRQWEVNLVITRKRVTKHGDFRALHEGGHQITVNEMPNPYRFLITTLHEIAHLVAYKNFGRTIKPHGKEWKTTYKKIMLPFLTPNIFPEALLEILQSHFRNPKASSDADFKLVMALNKFDPVNEKNYIFELERGEVFEIHNGRRFIRGKKRVKRYECREVDTRRMYLFSPHAQVIKIE